MSGSQTKQHGSSEVISSDWQKIQIAEKIKEKLEMLFKVEYDELVDQLEKMNKTSLVTLGDFIIKMVNVEIGKEDMYSRIGNTLTENLEKFKIEPRIMRICLLELRTL